MHQIYLTTSNPLPPPGRYRVQELDTAAAADILSDAMEEGVLCWNVTFPNTTAALETLCGFAVPRMWLRASHAGAPRFDWQDSVLVVKPIGRVARGAAIAPDDLRFVLITRSE